MRLSAVKQEEASQAVKFYYAPLCPASRKIMLVLAEKKLSFTAYEERPFIPSEGLYALSHEGLTPIIDIGGTVVVRDYAIQEFLDVYDKKVLLLGKTIRQQAEIRRLVSWFDERFQREITAPLIREKVMKRMRGRVDPHSFVLKEVRRSLYQHLDYISWLVLRRPWLGGGELSLADLAAAAHLSCIDYLGDVPWDKYDHAKTWYMRLKSRPSFRPILMESFAGIIPARHYRQLDF